MGPHALVRLYRNRLRVHPVEELLAGFVVAIAVALVFASLVANGSVTAAARQVAHTVIGRSDPRPARTSEGFDERLLERVQNLPGVEHAAPVLEQTATIVGPHHRRAIIDVVGANLGLARLDGLAHTLPVSIFNQEGIGLERHQRKRARDRTSGRLAQEAAVSLLMRGRLIPLKVSVILGPQTGGGLSRALAGVMPLERLQLLAGLREMDLADLRRADARPRAVSSRKLGSIGGGADNRRPSGPGRNAALTSAAPERTGEHTVRCDQRPARLPARVRAILLTVPERRRAIADLRLDGTSRASIVRMVAFQALCLGVLASLVGLEASATSYRPASSSAHRATYRRRSRSGRAR